MRPADAGIISVSGGMGGNIKSSVVGMGRPNLSNLGSESEGNGVVDFFGKMASVSFLGRFFFFARRGVFFEPNPPAANAILVAGGVGHMLLVQSPRTMQSDNRKEFTE